MMVSSPNMDLSAIIQTLESKKTNVEDRIEAYVTLSSQLKEDELSFASLDITKQAERVLGVLKKDVQSEAIGVQQGALEILGFCLHDAEIVRSLSATSTSQLLTSLRQCVEKTEDKTTATRALWCLSKQKCAESAIGKELPSLLDTCEHTFTKWKGQSTAVEHEALNVIARFVEQVPAEMKTHCSKWARLTIPLIVHPAVKIREKILTLLDITVTWMTASKELRHSLVPEFKSKICAEMKKLFPKNEAYVMKVWKLVVRFFGEELHSGSFINSILPIAELGFKHASPEIKIEAFKAWKSLIDNFALNPSIVCDPKRVKLIMQVFKINNAKVESIALEKLKIWWYFVKALGSKISQNFDQVVVPLLQFCLGGVKSNSVQATPTTPHMGIKNAILSPATPRLNLSICSPGLARPSFPSVQIQGCEILARVLACPSKMTDLPWVNLTLDGLSCEVITGTPMFLKHASVIVSTCLDLLSAQGAHIPESLLTYIWQCLIYHIRAAIESSSKSENREALSCFLGHFQTLVFSGTLSAKTVMKLFQPVCNLPQRALSSTAYSINSGEVVRGTPVLFLCEVLLAPTLLQDLACSENYISLFSTLINCGTSGITGVLEFCQAVLDVISRHATFITNPEALWRLWSILANTLQEHIIKTNEVNQGDSLEYNFDCMYAALMLPVKHKLGTQLSQPVCKSLLKTWGELYRSFARLSALVTNAEANISCEELSHKVLHSLEEDETKDASSVDFLAQMCQVVIDNVDFSSLGQNNSFTHGASLSPSKWIKRKHKPMENLHSFVKLLVRLLEDLASLSDQGETTLSSKQKPVSVTAGATYLVDVLATLFTHITISNIISKMLGQLSPPVAWFYSASAKKTCSKLFSSAFMQKLEKLWLDISTCIQSRYTMPYDTDFLQSVSPLLGETLLHPRRQIKNQALILWKATFSHAAPLDYPEDLKPVLTKVKEKTPILLPGWLQTDTAVIEETPFSQFSQMDSQAPDAHIPGLPSPRKILGSFMHKAVSPNIKKSPAKPPATHSPSVNTAKKKLSVSDLRDQDFVVIKTSPKKKRVLTEHQKEVLKERRSLPVMYNNLDLSQDVSLMSQFNTDTQQESIVIPSQSQDDSIIVINSSQSQHQEHPEKAKEQRPTVSKSSSSESLSEDGAGEVRRGRRRRSVRFSTDDKSDSGSQERKGEKSDIMSPPVSRTTRSRKEKMEGKEDKTDEKSAKKDTRSPEEEMDTTDKAKFVQESGDIEADVNFNVKPLESSSDVAASPSLKQNLMHAMGDQWLNTFSSKSTSSSSLGKADSSEEDKSQSGSDKESKAKNSQDSTSSSSQNSQEDTAKHFSPLKSFSQSPPERKPRSPGRRSRSQETPSSSKSPKRGRDGRSGQAGSLDRWLVKSPAKNKCLIEDSQKSPDDSFVPNTQSPKEMETSLLQNVMDDTISPVVTKGDRSSHSFVEDTQSPSKFSQQNVFSPDANASIEETPTKASEREVHSSAALASSRNLFTEDSEMSTQDETQSTNNTGADMHLGTPVIKIKKLTSEEIIELSHTSPAKEASKALFKEPMAVSKSTVSGENDSEIPCSQGFPTSSGSGKEGLKLESQISCGFSELFDTEKSSQGSDKEFSGILSAEQREELSHASTSSSDYSTSILNSEAVTSSQESDIGKNSEQSMMSDKAKHAEVNEDNFTEDMFQTCPDDKDTDAGYDPDAVSTLKEGSSQGSTGSKSSSQSTSSSQGSQECAGSEAVSDGIYDPNQTSTLAEETGRRRKQDTPKKLGLDDVRRTPRQRKKKSFDGFELDHPSESQDEMVDGTPVRKLGRPPSARKKMETIDEDKTESQKGKDEDASEKADGTSARKVGRPPGSRKMDNKNDNKEKKDDDKEKKDDDKEKKDANANEKEEEKPKRRVGRSRKSLVDKIDNETDQHPSQEPSKDSQDNSESVKRKGRKRKLEKDDGDEDEIPLSQISSQNESKSAGKRRGRSSQVGEEESKLPDTGEDAESDAPKKKRVRKSLVDEMTDSQELSQEVPPQDRILEPPVKKPRRIQLQPVEKSSPDENSEGFSSIQKKTLAIEPAPGEEKHLENPKESETNMVESDSNKDDSSEKSESKEPEKSFPEEDSTPFSEVIMVDMEVDNSEISSEQTQDESQQTTSEEITKEGEQTPTNKPSSAPVRRSTTKQKIEAARKRSLSKLSDKDADDSSVEDAVEWKELPAKTVLLEKESTEVEGNNVVCENIDSQMDLMDSQPVKKLSAVPNLSVSFCKDSPGGVEHERIKGKVNEIISSLASPVLSHKLSNRKHKRNLPKIKTASPLSVRLRSSKLVLRARAKLGIKTVSKASPLSLGSTRRRSSQSPKTTLFKDSQDLNDSTVDKCEKIIDTSEETGETKSVSVDDSNDIKGAENEDADTEVKTDEADSGDKNTSDKTASVPSASVTSSDNLDETPKKALESLKRRLPHVNRGFSDSKVLSLNKMRSKNKMTDRGMSIVRRSILKQKYVSNASSPSRKSSDSNFQPIRVFQFHSPSASPSAGILKKKRLSGGIPANSPSPPSKRRVSFAEPIISGESPLRSLSLGKVKGTPGKSVEPVAMDSQPSQSQTSFKSTQESQLNCTDPVYPDLIGCTESVTKVLPQLTSSVWSRGLGQLVKARNIHTVGDLSKLTEVDIHNLPIRSPKVVTVRRVLNDLEQHLEVRRSRDVKVTESDFDSEKGEAGAVKVPSVSVVTPLDTIEEDCETHNKENKEAHDEPDSLPSMDDALSQLSPKKDGEDLNSSIEAEPEDSTNMDVCEQPASQSQALSHPGQSDNVFQPDSQYQDVSQSRDSIQESDVSDNSESAGEKLTNTLDTLVKETDFESLQKMRTGDLFEVHQHLTQLSNMVITAMKSRCHSPPSSH